MSPYKFERYYSSQPHRKIIHIQPRQYGEAMDLARLLEKESEQRVPRRIEDKEINYIAFCFDNPKEEGYRIVFANPSGEHIIGIKAQTPEDLKKIAQQLNLSNPLTLKQQLVILGKQILQSIRRAYESFDSREYTQP